MGVCNRFFYFCFYLCFRSNLYLQQRPADPVAESVHLQSLANDTQEAVRRASDMLKQMECLKTEIKMLLTVSSQYNSTCKIVVETGRKVTVLLCQLM